MKVYWHSNLDDVNVEQWPSDIPCRPLVGDNVRSSLNWGTESSPRYLQLEVIQTTWYRAKDGYWRLEVELHLPKTRAEQIRQQFGGDWHKFYEWFKRPQEAESLSL